MMSGSMLPIVKFSDRDLEELVDQTESNTTTAVHRKRISR